MLIVTTTEADKIGVFAKQRFRLFPLAADRSRAGTPPSLAFETESNRWFPVDPAVVDLDRDGKQDLVVLQPENRTEVALEQRSVLSKALGNGL